ncbi:MAG: hypothetical protein JO086_06590 [Acidimicrobiia bacterium]|nr:hypothetical protein [Acidimicrobiia bacterium]
MTRERFYADRDRRTVEYGLVDPFEEPIGIVVSPAVAETPAGQVAALSLVNMAARLHRALRIAVPDVGLLVPSLAGETSLAAEVAALVYEIDPYNHLAVASSLRDVDIPRAAVGVGPVERLPLCLGADRYRACVGEHGSFSTDLSTLIGAAGAACLGAAALTRLSLGQPVAPRVVSMWDLTEEGGSGPSDGVDPLDLGTVAVVGAGAVASGLAYWTRYVGIRDDWVFVDGDLVQLHNTNRGLGLLARHAGWVDGEPSGDLASKAIVTAGLLAARGYDGWYDDWLLDAPRPPDLVLPLANGPGLRSAIGQRGEPILIHATTSRMWTADLHRHLAEEDDCIGCRLPEAQTVKLACGTSPIADGSTGNDSALPFLSSSAGLLLLVGLVHLANGRLVSLAANHWQLHLDLGDRRTMSSRRWSCAQACAVRRNMPRQLRRRLPRRGRWAHLD